MESLELLVRGLLALALMGGLMVAARARFRRREQAAPTDNGLD